MGGVFSISSLLTGIAEHKTELWGLSVAGVIGLEAEFCTLMDERLEHG